MVFPIAQLNQLLKPSFLEGISDENTSYLCLERLDKPPRG
jgi:hypothetical protein